jgi:hypothetical protein
VSVDLFQPLPDEGVRSVAFFNGRLLTAEDLRQDRDATRALQRLLGQALGDGVAGGLEVAEATALSSPQRPVVTVAPGLAVARTGAPLALSAAADVRLSPPAAAATAATPGSFDDCSILPPPGPAADAGLFVLTLAPAARGEGRVPVSGLAAAVATCNTRYTVEGVQFRLLPLPLTLADLANADRLRNEAAYRCFGTAGAAYAAAFQDPMGGGPRGYGLLDGLRLVGQLSDCEVPLALVRLTDTGVGFLDAWAVRRRVTRPDAGGPFGAFLADRRDAEGEAMFLQFQDHAADLLARSPQPAAVAADQFFHYLPPAGLLPVRTAAVPSGFDPATFFGGRFSGDPDVIAADQVPGLLREATRHAPIDLDTTESIRVYLIRPNAAAQAGGAKVQQAVLFASRELPFRGLARFGHAHFGFDNFVPAAG